MLVRTGRCLVVMVVLLAGSLYATSADAAPDNRSNGYRVVTLESLGGTSSAGNGINNQGWVTGYSNLPGDSARHATLWRDGETIDLGTLGGANSSTVWPVKNNGGLIAGIAETGAADPLGEAWSCAAFFPGGGTDSTCVGFVWERGTMHPLPTLGGNNGFATGVNNRGQVVGWAENAVEDATCNAPQVLQFRAAIWDVRRGGVQELPPLPGDTSSAATAINNRGQVVGISGICDNAVGRFSATSAVLWENGTAIDIGNLGGSAWHTPMAINDRGEVVGFSNHSASDGGAFNARAFYWSKSAGILDLGTLPGDSTSQALGINSRGQVVGVSCGASGCRGFLWEKGVMTDLNSLTGPGFVDHISVAGDINDRGQITGQLVDAQSGELRAFIATPHGGR